MVLDVNWLRQSLSACYTMKIVHGLEPSTDCPEDKGCFKRSRQGLEPRINIQEGVGSF